LGPWTAIDTVFPGDPGHFRNGEYTVIDPDSSFAGDASYSVVSVDQLGGKSGMTSNLTIYSNPVGISGKKQQLPESFSLSQNYPNPFNPATRIRYVIGSRMFVSLRVYDLLGKEIAALVNSRKQAGAYTVEFDASRLSSGIYFYRLQAGNFVETRKMILMR
ncbi:MAG: T9SS type A sorting domain-containing protein, partial [Desulfobacterales bacterium]